MPFAGIRAGVITTSGPHSPTVLAGVATLGLKLQINRSWVLACSANYHVADERIYDYEKTSPSTYDIENTDLTYDVGIRWLF
jgi:hypothetical protein